jgi:pimeloyl-ACP methyl ester carboxylesterase
MDHTLSFIEKGNGPVVVLLHGFCESTRIWDYFIDQLSSQFRVIAIDLPGFGNNPALEGDITMEELADKVFKQIYALTSEPFVLIAHSLGGYVALALAEQQPQTLRGLGLFHSTAYPDSDEKKEARTKSVDFLERLGIEAFIEGFVHPLFHFRNRRFLEKEMELVAEVGKATPTATAIAVTKAMRDRPDRTQVLKDARCPVLFIAGREDKAVDFETSKEQLLLPRQATVHVLAEVAHMGMFERREETLAMCRNFAQLCYLNTF